MKAKGVRHRNLEKALQTAMTSFTKEASMVIRGHRIKSSSSGVRTVRTQIRLICRLEDLNKKTQT